MKNNSNSTVGMVTVITLSLCFCCTSATVAPKSSPKTLTCTERMDLVGETMDKLRSKIPAPELDMSVLKKTDGEYDAATLYALAIATIKYQDDEAGWRKAGKHMLKAAEMAYPNAEVAVAIKLHSRLSGDWSADYLRELCSMSIYEALETDERKAHYTDVPANSTPRR